jgi:hypothetical protein
MASGAGERAEDIWTTVMWEGVRRYYVMYVEAVRWLYHVKSPYSHKCAKQVDEVPLYGFRACVEAPWVPAVMLNSH